MSESKNDDPFRKMRDAYLEGLSKAAIEFVNNEAYAQAAGSMLESYLTALSPFREAMEAGMLRIMEQFSVPSRQDLASMAERFTNVEMRLCDVDAKLDKLLTEFEGVRQSLAPASQSKASQSTADPSPQAKHHSVDGSAGKRSPASHGVTHAHH
jgi:hypothetical protein